MGKDDVRKIVNELIEQNQEEILDYLQKKLVEARESAMSLMLNPWDLVISNDIKLEGRDLVDGNMKTYFKFDEELKPCIGYSKEMDLYQAKFFLMMEVAYYFMIKYIVDYKLFYMDKAEFKNVSFNDVSVRGIYEIMEDNGFIMQVIRDFAFESIVPWTIFSNSSFKNLSRRDFSQYFGISEEVIDYYLKEENMPKRRRFKSLFDI